ncbi:hypothetical protein EYF80_046414 [Liparis tanakae]|uniref:Uncharacterized protein n=1 Tax=Liparis tanakae TaxID=230148 RepID=A0A4Z2FRB8_9TELE|nr:hypothetical protein EYF80_046414 [Liparis tanakae]
MVLSQFHTQILYTVMEGGEVGIEVLDGSKLQSVFLAPFSTFSYSMRQLKDFESFASRTDCCAAMSNSTILVGGTKLTDTLPWPVELWRK